MLNAAVGIPAAAFVFIGLQFTGYRESSDR